MSKTIFVIGANSALAKELIMRLAPGNTVIAGARKGADVDCDITKPITIPAGTEVVVNAAAAFGGTTDAEISEAVQTNVLGLLNICSASKQAGVRHIVHISSLSAVHAPTSPYYSIYALTKRQGDELAAWYCALNHVPLTILRPSQVYGDDVGFAKHQPLLYHMADQAARGQDITIYGRHDALRNYLHSHDLGETIQRVIERSITGTYACLYPTNLRLSEIARAAQQAFDKGGEVTFLDDKPDIPDNVFTLDMSIYEKIGYYPKVTLAEGMRRIRAHREGA
ncbi:MAG TPA: NAD(P)-dependent oxidoreductase [Candidatus Saccharimonadales bacterium]|nr:NAD(P)-dependent oxidoreductase [Candidatus Saccharimonadales bacterium]